MKLKSLNNQELNLEKINVICNIAGKNSEKIAEIFLERIEVMFDEPEDEDDF